MSASPAGLPRNVSGMPKRLGSAPHAGSPPRPWAGERRPRGCRDTRWLAPAGGGGDHHGVLNRVVGIVSAFASAFMLSPLTFMGCEAVARLAGIEWVRVQLPSLVVSIGVVPIAAATAMGWWLRPRIAFGLCRRCGYDLRGGSGPACPECGEATTVTGSA